jgi:hypothetical protein
MHPTTTLSLLRAKHQHARPLFEVMQGFDLCRVVALGQRKAAPEVIVTGAEPASNPLVHGAISGGG